MMASKIGTGERLRLIRGYQSQADFAGTLGISEQLYRQFEREECSPDLNFLAQLKSATGCSLDWLASGRRSDEYRTIESEKLASIISSIEREVPNLDVPSKVRLIARLYEEFQERGKSFEPSSSKGLTEIKRKSRK